MIQLVVREAEPSDRQKLSRFTCTTPRVKREGSWAHTHESQHELDVQSTIRDREKAFSGLGRRYLLGLEPDGEVAWACLSRQVDSPALVHIELMAVALRHRRSGGEVARHMVEHWVRAIRSDARPLDISEIGVTANIHKDNKPSMRLCAQAGMHHVDWVQGRPYQTWAGVLHVPARDFGD